MRSLISLFIMLFILSGCFLQEQTTMPVETLTIYPTGQDLNSVTRPVVDQTVTPSQTRREFKTVLPSLSLTITPDRTHTPVPIVTLTKDEAKSIINVLEGAPSCKLPCWLGLTPGVSTFSDIQGFAAKLGMYFFEDRYNQEEDMALFHVTNSENYKENPSNMEGNPTSVEVYWQDGVIKSIVILPNEVPTFLRVEQQRRSLGDPEQIFLTGPYNGVMGFILDYHTHGFVFSLSSVTSKQATICLDDTLNKKIILELYDPDDPVNILNQVNLFGDLVWPTQPDPGFSTHEIMDRIVSKECLHYSDFTNQW